MQLQISSRRENGWRDTQVVKIRVFWKVFSKQFCFISTDDNTSGLMDRGGTADIPFLIKLLTIRQKSPQPSFWEVMDSCFISICKFGSFKNPFATITSLSELFFRCRTFILSVKIKEVISISYGRSKSTWKPWRWMRLDLIFTIRDIYLNSDLASFSEFRSSSRTIEGITLWVWRKVVEAEKQHNQNFSRWENCRTNARARKYKSKRGDLWVSQSDIKVGKLS